MQNFKATTIIAVKKDGKTAIAGDGQVTFGQAAIMKANARKVRRLYNGKVLAGFAGSVADAFTLFEKFESFVANKKRFKDESEQVYKEALEKYQ